MTTVETLERLLEDADFGHASTVWNGLLGAGSEHMVRAKSGVFSVAGGTGQRRTDRAILIAAAVNALPALLAVAKAASKLHSIKIVCICRDWTGFRGEDQPLDPSCEMCALRAALDRLDGRQP